MPMGDTYGLIMKYTMEVCFCFYHVHHFYLKKIIGDNLNPGVMNPFLFSDLKKTLLCVIYDEIEKPATGFQQDGLQTCSLKIASE